MPCLFLTIRKQPKQMLRTLTSGYQHIQEPDSTKKRSIEQLQPKPYKKLSTRTEYIITFHNIKPHIMLKSPVDHQFVIVGRLKSACNPPAETFLPGNTEMTQKY